MKKFISAMLIILIALSGQAIVCAQTETASARLYNYYDDGMLFKHSSEAIFAGTATPNAEITVELIDSNGSAVRSGNGTVSADGTFNVSFTSPEGGFGEYNVVLKENGITFDTLENVVFGELWIACGQSNMSYPLGQSKTGIESIEKGEKFNKWVRALIIPFYPLNGDENDPVPADPQTEYYDAFWTNGEESHIQGVSAVGYYFAEKLVDELGMPVGILNTSLGGSGIISWLSREAIDTDEQVKNDLIQHGDYIKYNKWKENEQNIYGDMSANFNSKIAPLSNFRVSGMIWYQGESDINSNWNSERFKRTFRLIQESYTEHFSYSDGLMPVIATQIAPFLYYSETALAERNEDFASLHYERPDSIAVTSIHDVPLTYTPVVGAIHPESKFEVGNRMAYSAMSLVYGEENACSAALPESCEIKDGCAYVKLKNVGDGLAVKGKSLKGFTVCGDNGIYLPAEAEIVSTDTVKVSNADITEPKSVAYAYCATNFESNLYATENGELAIPVSPFVTNKEYNKHFWVERHWNECESEKIWHSEGQETTGYFDSWLTENANISFTSSSCYSGENGMEIKSESSEFSVKPVMTFVGTDGKISRISDNDHNYTDYGTMSFYIRNNGNNDVTLTSVDIYRDLKYKYSPAVNETTDISAVIPADGQWHKITLNLNKLYTNGNNCLPSITNNKLIRTTDIIFNFEGEGSSDLSFDHVRFTSESGKEKMSFDADYDNAETFFEKICVALTKFIGLIFSVFI